MRFYLLLHFYLGNEFLGQCLHPVGFEAYAGLISMIEDAPYLSDLEHGGTHPQWKNLKIPTNIINGYDIKNQTIYIKVMQIMT